MLIDENKCYKMIIDSVLVQANVGLVGVFNAKVKGVSSKIFLGAAPPDPLTFILFNLICCGQATGSIESHD